MTDITTDPVILGKSDVGALDRRPIGFSCLTPKHPDSNVINGSSIWDSCVVSVEDDRSRKGKRKAQALKANLAKRKQQQRARTIATSATQAQSHSEAPQ